MKFSILGLLAFTGMINFAMAQSQDLRCHFDFDAKSGTECTAKVSFCVTPPPQAENGGGECVPHFDVSCGGVTVYEGAFATGYHKDDFIFQGITTLENMNPPSLFVEGFVVTQSHDSNEYHACLTSVYGKVKGECKMKGDGI